MLAVACIVDLAVPQLDLPTFADGRAAHREKDDDRDGGNCQRNENGCPAGCELAIATVVLRDQ
jgi:hypothetical protein